MSEPVHSRRVMLQILGAAGGALAAFSAVGCGGEESSSSSPSGGGSAAPTAAANACDDTTGVDTTMRTQLQYNPHGPDETRHCVHCALFTANGDCGTCQLFPGPITHTGTCVSFAPRPS